MYVFVPLSRVQKSLGRTTCAKRVEGYSWVKKNKELNKQEKTELSKEQITAPPYLGDIRQFPPPQDG